MKLQDGLYRGWSFLKERVFLVSTVIIIALPGCTESPQSIGQETPSIKTTQNENLYIKDSSLTQNQSDDIEKGSKRAENGQLDAPMLDAKAYSSELDSHVLRSIAGLSKRQGQAIDARSVDELELLSEADRQKLQALAAQQTMNAAEQLASQQVESAAIIKENK